MDQVTGMTRQTWTAAGILLISGVCAMSFLAGCASMSSRAARPSGQDSQFQSVAVDIYQNEESRSAAKKILGVDAEKPVVKYSPVTGKHYSGDLEFDPETGAKLEVVPE